jgi:hypothetical protein
MIYLLAIFLPPLGLLFNGQPLSAIWYCSSSASSSAGSYAVRHPVDPCGAGAMKREDRKHREIVDAIERHGPPPR